MGGRLDLVAGTRLGLRFIGGSGLGGVARRGGGWLCSSQHMKKGEMRQRRPHFKS